MPLTGLIDTHCHLNDTKAFTDPGNAITEAENAGVSGIIVVGIDTESSKLALDIAENHDSVFAIVGWHPNYTANYTSAKLNEIEDLSKHPKAVAIGEIGLDFHWTYATLEQQERALHDQLALAKALNMPVVFHCREAYPALLDLLEQDPPGPNLFHCFAGSQEDANRARKLDSWFGVDGPVTYKKADDLRAVLRTVPQNRIVLETDSPWLTPHPYRGKPNKPAHLPLICQGLADTLEIPAESCAIQTSANARAFFRLPDF